MLDGEAGTQAHGPDVPGTLFAIGGAEAKLRRRTVLRAFVDAAGGSGRADRGGAERLVAGA